MLKKVNRLSSKFQFNVVRKYGNRNWFEFFQAGYVKPTNYTGPTKIGFVVSNQVHKNATKRNRIKRILREVIRKNIQLIPNDLWIVINVNNKILDKTHEEISDQVNRFIQKISVSN